MPSITKFPVIATGSGWTNPVNAKVSDNVYSTCFASNNIQTDILFAKTFQFGIPTDYVVTGIEVAVEAKATGTGAIFDIVKLSRDGVSLSGDNLSNSTVVPTTESTKNFGSSTSMWGLDLSPADVNASGFSVGVVFRDSAYSLISVDAIAMTVYYTENTGIGMFTKVGGVIKNVDKGFTKVNGLWKPVEKVFKKVSGTWLE